MMKIPGVIYLSITLCLAAPIDDPIRIELPVYNDPVPSANIESQNLLPENHPGGDVVSDNSLLGTLNQKILTSGSLLSKKEEVSGVFAPRPTKLESAILETEGFPSKALSIKDNLHQTIASIFQPKPIVDTIREEEKYGNNGDKFYKAGQAIVGGASSVSTLLNNALEVPGNIFKKLSRAATEKLNNLGGKLIGL